MNDFTKIIDMLETEKAVKFLQRLIAFNTTNPPGEEKAIAVYLKETLEELGICSHIDELDTNRANVIGCVKGSGDYRGLLLNGHLDVVPPGEIPWEHDPFGGEIDNGKIYGRGTSDMKSGLAALIVAAGLIIQSGTKLKGDLLIAGTAGEETDSIGARQLLQKGYLKNVGAAVIAEPSNLKIFSATKGALWLQFITKGATAHGSMPDQGNNAIIQMNALINELIQYNFGAVSHDFLGRPSMNIGTIQGGVKTNVVPDSCILTVDMRTVPGQDHNQIIADMHDLLAKLSQSTEGFHGELRITNDRPPVETDPACSFMQQGITAARKALGAELVPCGVNYYTDASIFMPELGIPVLWLGPGDEKTAHKPDEYVEIDKYIDAIKFYTALILEWDKGTV